MKTPFELATGRYATKKYDTTKKVSEVKIAELKEVLRLSPSSINIQPWKFTFVQDQEIKSRLASASLFNEEKINQADLLIVFSYPSDLDAFQKIVDKKLPESTRDVYNSAIRGMNEEEIKNWFIRQVYLALGIALNTSAALGLDTTPMEGIETGKYAQILHMKNYHPILALAVGHGDKEDYNRPQIKPKSRLKIDEVVEVF